MTFYDQISSPIIKRAYSYVMGNRSISGLPSRSEIDPIHMSEYLDHVELLDVINGGETFRYRIAGGAIEQIFHSKMQGRMLEDIFTGDVLSFKLVMFRRCVENRTVILSNDTLERGGELLLKYERLLIPLSPDGTLVNILFGCTYPMKIRASTLSMSDPDLKIISEAYVEGWEN